MRVQGEVPVADALVDEDSNGQAHWHEEEVSSGSLLLVPLEQIYYAGL